MVAEDPALTAGVMAAVQGPVLMVEEAVAAGHTAVAIAKGVVTVAAAEEEVVN